MKEFQGEQVTEQSVLILLSRITQKSTGQMASSILMWVISKRELSMPHHAKKTILDQEGRMRGQRQ